jgi:hypothetical protein
MRCPHCSAEQPGGVTVCGFCGALMAEAASPFRAASAEPPGRSWRWAVLVAGALAVGLTAGILLRGFESSPPPAATARPSADGAAEPFGDELTPAAPPAGDGPFEAAPGRAVVRGRDMGPLTVERLEEFAARLAELAATGDARALAAVVDTRARYRSTMDDAHGRRELDGGKPELLAHWLALWLAAERVGGMVDELVEMQSVRVAPDPRQGIVVRRLEAGGDVTRVTYPRELLGPLAAAGALAPRATEALDLAPLTAGHERCVATETMRVALAPTGLRVIEVERIGRCD